MTREQWILPLLRTFGFGDIRFSRTAAQVGGRSYFISHRAGDGEDGLPIHIEGFRNDLDRRPPTSRPRISPHALVQEYLNRTDHLWGIVANGHQLRVLRDSARLSRPTYLEFDLKQIMEAAHFADFQVLYRIVHRTRWPRDVDSAPECLLESYYQQGIDSGGRVRDRLRDGVEEALKTFGNGFLSHPNNGFLREKIGSGQLTAGDYYRQLLRLIYRFLFLMVAEERNLVGPDLPERRRSQSGPAMDLYREIYDRYYSISRLREKVERPFNPEERHRDLWEGVKQTFDLYRLESEGEKLRIKPLDGDLFGQYALPDLEDTSLYNRDLLRGFAQLSLFKDEKVTRRINYTHLDVEELGSVYESLLDYHPVIERPDGDLKFVLAFGTERKSTGSYYTRTELVHELVQSALVPVIEERLGRASTREEKGKALLSLKVCDPAAGSGHFLLAAARRIGKELAKVRTGEEEPTPTRYREAVREVIRHCIYAVDLNPLAVDLCKVALWIEGHNRGLPLTFLDHRVKYGNSLIGLDSLDRLKDGIPNDAFKLVTGDDRDVAKKIKAINRRQLKTWEEGVWQQSLGLAEKLEQDLESFAELACRIEAISEKDPTGVTRKKAAYDEAQAKRAWLRDKTAANIWTAAFFCPLTDVGDPAIPTHDRLISYLENPHSAHGRLVGGADQLASDHKFFHWPLEFPEVYHQGGFDVVLGNPPWERIKLQEKEFFETRDPQIAGAPNKAERARLIKELKDTDPELAKGFESAKHDAESQSRFVRASGRLPFTAVGDVNTYGLFAELSRGLLNKTGRAGIIVPTGIATDDTYKKFFSDLNSLKSLFSLYDFENREKLFPAVDSRYKFSLLTVSKKPVERTRFAFFLTRTEHLDDEMRRFHLLPKDIELINPNTRTMPVFRTEIDAELTVKIYRRVPVLVNEKTGENPWGIRFMTMFHMANDSNLFCREPGEGRIPLYEAKMIWQYDHRFGTYEGVDPKSTSTHLPIPTPEQYADPHHTVRPRYWVEEKEVEARLEGKWDRKWLLGFRDVARSTDVRTAIFGLLPRVGVGNNAPIVLIDDELLKFVHLFVANCSTMTFDWVARQKIAGTHMNFFFVKQLPVLAPGSYSSEDIDFIKPRVIELVYTSWDLKPFAEDMGYQGEPFCWDEDRRAILKAELDAYYAHLYGLTRDELRYILDPKEIHGEDFPGETFRVLKEKEIKKYGEYRTQRLVLEAYDKL